MRGAAIVGYAYEADIHCPPCTMARFHRYIEDSGDHDLQEVEDSEGNTIHPIFAMDEGSEQGYCGDCHERLMDI